MGGALVRRLGIALAVAVLVAPLAGCGRFPMGDGLWMQDGEADAQLSYADVYQGRFYPGTGDDTREIVCWGDSMTQGVGADAGADSLVLLADGELYDTSHQSYPQVLSQLTGLDTYNFGVAGATSEEIAVMQGALPWTALDIADAADGDPDVGDAAITVSRLDPEVAEAGEEHTGDILVLEIGSNGGWGDDYQVLIDQYRAMIERSGCEDYLILGDTDDPGTSVGDTSQEPFTEGYAPRETAWEAALSEAFGERFINVRVFLIKHGLDISGLAPTEEDVADARLGCISKQLRSDWTHLNARGYFAKAVAIYRRGVRLGCWSAGEGSIDVAVPHGHHQQAEGQR